MWWQGWAHRLSSVSIHIISLTIVCMTATLSPSSAHAGVVGNPQVSLSTNQETYNPGDTLVLNATLQAGTENNVVDGYIVAISPDGSAFFLNDDLTTFTPLSDGAASSTAELPVGRTDLLQTTPAVVRSFGIVDATVQVFSRIVEKALPAGRYAIMAIAAKAGSKVLDVFNWVTLGVTKVGLGGFVDPTTTDISCPPPSLPELSPADDPGERIPLILIHGIAFGNTGGHRCQWDNFLKALSGDLDLSGGDGRPARVKPYLFAYESSTSARAATNDFSIKELGRFLGDAIRERFGEKPVLLIGHSMGGLIARSFMQEYTYPSGQQGGERVLRLITLATPHRGTPAVNVISPFLFNTRHGQDMRWDEYDGQLIIPTPYGNIDFNDNVWLRCLNGNGIVRCAGVEGKQFFEKIIAYGGDNPDLIQRNWYYQLTQSAMCGVVKPPRFCTNDGVVPGESAFFNGPTLAGSFLMPKGYDHSDMVTGKAGDPILFQRLINHLKEALPPLPANLPAHDHQPHP